MKTRTKNRKSFILSTSVTNDEAKDVYLLCDFNEISVAVYLRTLVEKDLERNSYMINRIKSEMISEGVKL